jgi:hypothetical protein
VSPGQPYSFSFSDSLLAEAGQVPQSALHFDVEAIAKAYAAVGPVAKLLGVAPPVPRLAGFTYAQVAALGLPITFTDYEPKAEPLLHTPEEIDTLKEPENYLGAELTERRLGICAELQRRFPESPNFIGHFFEGPITTAALLLGQDFLTLPYDDPPRAHRLLQFCVTSAQHYAACLNRYFGGATSAFMSGGFPDDFAGMLGPNLFAEFVVPYWDQLYVWMNAGQRMLHSELLTIEHLPYLAKVKLDFYDPGVDQYLTPELLRAHCPMRVQCRITEWQVRDLDAAALQARYRYLAGFQPYSIQFELTRLQDLPKVQALMEVARELAG